MVDLEPNTERREALDKTLPEQLEDYIYLTCPPPITQGAINGICLLIALELEDRLDSSTNDTERLNSVAALITELRGRAKPPIDGAILLAAKALSKTLLSDVMAWSPSAAEKADETRHRGG